MLLQVEGEDVRFGECGGTEGAGEGGGRRGVRELSHGGRLGGDCGEGEATGQD